MIRNTPTEHTTPYAGDDAGGAQAPLLRLTIAALLALLALGAAGGLLVTH